MASRGLSFLSGLHPSAPRTLTPRYPHSHPHSYPHSYSHPPHLHLHPQPHPHQGAEDPLVALLRSDSAVQSIRACPLPAGGAVLFSHRVMHWGSRGHPRCTTPRLSEPEPEPQPQPQP